MTEHVSRRTYVFKASGRALRALIWRVRCWVAVQFARHQSFRRLRNAPVQRVLVVCYGNIYRSAYVGMMLARLIGPNKEVRSGGFHPKAGRECPQRLQKMARLKGIDLAAHRSRIVEPADLEWADTILLMDRHNWQDLIQQGAAAQRFVWIGALDGGAPEVMDPHDLDNAATQAIVDRLHLCAERLVALIDEAHAATCR